MRFSLVGSNGVGKTSLIERFKVDYSRHFDCVTESRPTAAAIKMGYKSARDIPYQQQWEFQVESLLQQLKYQDSVGQIAAFDRATIDFLAYTNMKMPWKKHTVEHQLYEKIAVESARNFWDKIILVPHFSLDIEDNFVRLMEDPRPTENEIISILEKHNIEYYRLKTVGLDNRYQELLEILEL